MASHHILHPLELERETYLEHLMHIGTVVVKINYTMIIIEHHSAVLCLLSFKLWMCLSYEVTVTCSLVYTKQVQK